MILFLELYRAVQMVLSVSGISQRCADDTVSGVAQGCAGGPPVSGTTQECADGSVCFWNWSSIMEKNAN